MKQEDRALDLMQVDQVAAFVPHLARAHEVASRRRQRASPARRVQTVVADDAQLAREEVVGQFLQAPVRARHDENLRPIDRPPLTGTHSTSLNDADLWRRE